MSGYRHALVIFLGVGAAVLSFDALRAYALDQALVSGVIPLHTVAPRGWLATLWAIEVDGMAAAGILGIRARRGDWKAWAMFILALGASLGFQVFALPAIVARAVPPVALALAIVVLELPTQREAEDAAVGESPTPVEAVEESTPRKLTPADREALRRAHKRGPERVAEVVAQRNLDPALARTNGHRTLEGATT